MLDQPVVDMWGYRPAQTVVSVPYMLSEGAWLTNIMPMFGEPWIFPQEFPLYQCCVAALSWALGLPVNSAGCVVGALFAVACVWPIYLVAEATRVPDNHRVTLLVSTLWFLVFGSSSAILGKSNSD